MLKPGDRLGANNRPRP